jgi:hypothetical protein
MDRASLGWRIKTVLMAPVKLISAFLEQATAQGSRSTVLRPLGWFLSIFTAGILSALWLKAPLWLIVFFTSTLGIGAFFYLAAFAYCLIYDREALRSETYSIQKLAIEKGFRGDSITGVVMAAEERPASLLENIGNQTGPEPR